MRAVRPPPGLISVRDPAVQSVGDVMVDGVIPRKALRPFGLWRPSTQWWRERNAGSRPRRIGQPGGRARTREPSGGSQGFVAEFAQGVEAALEQLAREREAGAVAAEAVGGLLVVDHGQRDGDLLARAAWCRAAPRSRPARPGAPGRRWRAGPRRRSASQSSPPA